MTPDEVADKFTGNAEFAKWPSQKTESVIELVKSFKTMPEMNRLSAALASWVIALKWSRENRARVSFWHVPVQAFSRQWAPLTPSRSTSRGLAGKTKIKTPPVARRAPFSSRSILRDDTWGLPR